MKLNKKQFTIMLLVSIIFTIGSFFSFEFLKEKSKLLLYSKDEKNIKINIFDKLLKKKSSEILINSDDPKVMNLYRNINKNTDVIVTYNKDSKKIIIKTLQDKIYIDNKEIQNNPIIIKEISANEGDSLVFNKNILNISADMKNVFKMKDFGEKIILQMKESSNVINLLKDFNYSFEGGLWNKNADICEKQNNNETKYSQSIEHDCSEGKNCLLLSSNNNTACVSNFFTVNLNKEQTYSISFDYKSLEEKSIAFGSIVLIGSDGKNAYYTANITPEKYFKQFKYNFNLEQNVVGVIVKFNVKSNDENTSSVVFDNIEVKNIGNTNVYLNTRDVFKNYPYGDVRFVNGKNIFTSSPVNDSEVSQNIYDYYLSFKDTSQSSSFIGKIKMQEALYRLSIFSFIIFLILSILSFINIFYKTILNILKNAYKHIYNKALEVPKTIINSFKNKLASIKKEGTLFLTLKISTILIINLSYIFSTIFFTHNLNLLSLFALFYGSISILFVIDSRISASIAIIYLILCPLTLILKKESIAENMAVQTFYFLFITAVTQIRENMKENKTSNQ